MAKLYVVVLRSKKLKLASDISSFYEPKLGLHKYISNKMCNNSNKHDVNLLIVFKIVNYVAGEVIAKAIN